jgi:hypothetical protein
MLAKNLLPYLGAAVFFSTAPLTAQGPAEAAHSYTTAHQPELVQRFSDLLAIPNVAADPAGLKRNADLL